MSLQDLNKFDIPDALIKSFFNEGVVAFVGSGPSIHAGLVDWSKFIRLMAEEAKLYLSEEEILFVNRYIDRENLLIVADFLRSKLTEDQFAELLEREFLDKKPSNIHKAIVSLPLLRGIITTNYDLLLSEADTSRRFSHVFTWHDSSLIRKFNRPFILHAHGTVINSEMIIISASDYDKLSLDQRAKQFWKILENIFVNHRVLFIGYRLNDPDFNLFLAELRHIYHGLNRDQFILVVEDEDPLKTYDLTRRGIRPIFIDKSPSIGLAILEWLNELNKKICEREKREIAPISVDIDRESSKVSVHQINSFLEPLIDYLSTKYHTIDSANNILEIISNTERFSSNKTIENFWKDYIESSFKNNSPAEFRNIIVELSKKDPKEGLLKRILSHILP